jgi:hypothetical protein
LQLTASLSHLLGQFLLPIRVLPDGQWLQPNDEGQLHFWRAPPWEDQAAEKLESRQSPTDARAKSYGFY